MPSSSPLCRRLGILEANVEAGFRVPDMRGKGRQQDGAEGETELMQATNL